ncbi:MAG TPA: nitroreductase family protein [Acidobacteriaceae bacterium]|nr:nitroreductase family protein [Acidobacteriaceae bacterium]
MPDISPEAVDKLKHAPGESGVQESIRRRWSPRAFADKEVSSDTLKSLFEAARWAASSSNEQPWRFLVGRRGDPTYKKIFDSLVEFNQMWAKSAPVLLLSVAKKTFTEKGNPNRVALHDTGAATANLSLQATASGLHTHSMAGFDSDRVRASFGIPSDYEIGAVTAIGYFGDPSTLHERMQKSELAPRQRKPLEEFVFSDWEKPAQF